MIIKLDSAASADTYSQGTVIDNAAQNGSSITSFDTVLNEAKKSYSAWNPENDIIIQACDLSESERAKLYSELGITSPAGTPVTQEADGTTRYCSDSQTTACSVNVPSNLVSVFEKASAASGVSYDLLVSVAKAESDFNAKCTSSSGAMGIMQLMPATAKYMGVEDAYNAESNIMGGAKYLAEKLKEHGSISLGVAAYNAGSNAVEKYGGIPPYTETQNYVKKVLSYMGSDGNGTGLLNAVQATTSDNATAQAASEASSLNDSAAAGNSTAPEGATVTVSGVKMTYTAYLRYLELMDLGVG